MDSMMEIEALFLEARRRGITYGKLVAALTPKEREDAVRRYRAERNAEKRKKKGN